MILEALAAFSLMFTLDFIYSAYTKSIADSLPMRSSLWASALIVVNGGVVLSYTANPWMLIPIALGAFGGTYTEIWWRLRRQRRLKQRFNTAGTL
jgi:hypothetical protein